MNFLAVALALSSALPRCVQVSSPRDDALTMQVVAQLTARVARPVVVAVQADATVRGVCDVLVLFDPPSNRVGVVVWSTQGIEVEDRFSFDSASLAERIAESVRAGVLEIAEREKRREALVEKFVVGASLVGSASAGGFTPLVGVDAILGVQIDSVLNVRFLIEVPMLAARFAATEGTIWLRPISSTIGLQSKLRVTPALSLGVTLGAGLSALILTSVAATSSVATSLSRLVGMLQAEASLHVRVAVHVRLCVGVRAQLALPRLEIVLGGATVASYGWPTGSLALGVESPW